MSDTPVVAAGDVEELSPDEILKIVDGLPYIEEWDGYDLDKTLAHFDKWESPLVIGSPIPAMIERVKQSLASGREVKIFTARVSYADERINRAVRKAIEAWCVEHIGQVLEITNIKDIAMRNLFDDRAWHVIPNEGVVLSA